MKVWPRVPVPSMKNVVSKESGAAEKHKDRQSHKGKTRDADEEISVSQSKNQSTNDHPPSAMVEIQTFVFKQSTSKPFPISSRALLGQSFAS